MFSAVVCMNAVPKRKRIRIIHQTQDDDAGVLSGPQRDSKSPSKLHKRTIKIFAILNVMSAAILFVWFQSIPEPTPLAVNVQQLVDASTDLDSEFRLQVVSASRDDWAWRATQYSYWAAAAGIVIVLNALVFLIHLAGLTSDPSKPAQTPASGMESH